MNTGRYRLSAVFFLAVSMLCLAAKPFPAGAAFFKKQFTVRQDRGRDVLCDPYTVQKNDYLIKLFKQKGEISHEDFPEFLEIFKRLNPDVEDIDRIYPGSRILIPLKILKPGTLEGQETGTVSMPIVMVNSLPDLVRDHSSVYRVKAGDTLWKVLVRRFGGLTDREYVKLLSLVKYMNPDLENADLIRAGERIRMPESSVRNTLWYDAIFDESGRLVSSSAFKKDSIHAPQKKGKDEAEAAGPLAAEKGAGGGGSPLEKKGPAGVSGPEERKPDSYRQRRIYEKAARVLGAELLASGDFFFPRKASGDFRVDLDKTPVMDMPDAMRVIFDSRGLFSERDLSFIKKYWKDLAVVRTGGDLTLRGLMNKLCPVIDSSGCENRISFSDGGVEVTVRGEYIYDRMDEDGKICLTFIDSPEKRTPPEIRSYLGHNWIVVEDWVHNKEGLFPVRPPEAGGNPECDEEKNRGAVFKAGRIPETRQKEFVRRLAGFLDCSLQEEVEVSFPYAGFQVKALSNMMFTPDGSRGFLVDFGGLQGNAAEAIEGTGLPVIQITADIDGREIVCRILSELNAEKKKAPLFWTAKRRRIHNTSVQIPGEIFSFTGASGHRRKIFVPEAELPPELCCFVSGRGFEVLQLNEQ